MVGHAIAEPKQWRSLQRWTGAPEDLPEVTAAIGAMVSDRMLSARPTASRARSSSSSAPRPADQPRGSTIDRAVSQVRPLLACRLPVAAAALIVAPLSVSSLVPCPGRLITSASAVVSVSVGGSCGTTPRPAVQAAWKPPNEVLEQLASCFDQVMDVNGGVGRSARTREWRRRRTATSLRPSGLAGGRSSLRPPP